MLRILSIKVLKLDTKGQIFYDSTYMKLSRIGNSRDRNQMRGYQVMFSAESLSGVCLFATPGSSVHGIFQARIMEWVAIPFSGGFYQLRDQTQVSCIVGRFFIVLAIREAQEARCRRLPCDSIT